MDQSHQEVSMQRPTDNSYRLPNMKSMEMQVRGDGSRELSGFQGKNNDLLRQLEDSKRQ